MGTPRFGVRDAKENCVAEEAKKLLTGNTSAELKVFYREVLKHEEGVATSVHHRESGDED